MVELTRDDTEQRRALELAGVDALETTSAREQTRVARAWSASWPKLLAAAVFLALWQAVVWSGWRPSYVLPGPVPVLGGLVDGFTGSGPTDLRLATAVTLVRAVVGFGLAVAIGVVVGLVVSVSRVVRTGVGSLITGVQTMPSIAWFPLAIVLFELSERAILFVVVLGAAPAIANGLLHGIDQTPPILHRAGRVLGATGWDRYRFVVLPAAVPGFVGGLKQGWAFAWRSLMAGELLRVIANRPSLGGALQFARDFSNAQALLASMVLILVIGLLVDALLFGTLERRVRHRWGLTV